MHKLCNAVINDVLIIIMLFCIHDDVHVEKPKEESKYQSFKKFEL